MSSNPSGEQSQLQQCATELMDAMPSVMQFIRSEMRRQNASLLSVPQFRVLAFLRLHPGASLSEVAEHLGVTRATASAMTERLVQRNLVDRSTHPQERRQVKLSLTTAGLTLLQQSREKTRDQIALLMAGLTVEELGSLSQGLALLKQVFSAANS